MNLKISHLENCMDYLDEISVRMFKEFKDDSMAILSVNSAADLKSYYEENFSHDWHLPSGYVVVNGNEGNELVGFIAIQFNSYFNKHPYRRKIPWITNVYVVPKYRKKGVGKSMVQSMFDIIKKRYKHNEVYVWVNRTDSREFFRKIGFYAFDQAKVGDKTYTMMKYWITPPKKLIQPVHIIGLFVLIVIFYTIRSVWLFLVGFIPQRPITIMVYK